MTELEFGARLKQLRQEKRLTQQELADQLNVSNKSVSRWESGGYPDITLLLPLSRALGVTVDELLTGQRPLRRFGRSDWQSLMSYGFGLGGGAIFFLLDLFMPSLLCYLLYLGMMAYGVYLQRHYTYYSRWFYAANLIMNFFVHMQLTSFVAASKIVMMGDEVFLSLVDQFFALGRTEQGVFLRELLEYVLPWFLAAFVLTAAVQLVIYKTAAKRAFPGCVPWKISLKFQAVQAEQLLPLLSPAILTVFWGIYNVEGSLGQWMYENQTNLYLGLWLLLSGVFLGYLLKKRNHIRTLAFIVMQLCCLSAPALAANRRVFSLRSLRLIPYTDYSNPAQHILFGELGGWLLVMYLVLAGLYLLCTWMKFEKK